MSLNRLFPSQQLLFALVTVAILHLPTSAWAQDSVTQANGLVRSGQITGVRNGNIILKLPEGEIGIPLAQTAVSMAAPRELSRGLDLQEAGKAPEALAILKPIADTYGGLPTDWAQSATAAVGDLYLSLGKTDAAAAAYTKFKQLYPSGNQSLQATVGLARVSFANNKIAEAKDALTPIAAASLTKPDLTKAESAAYGQACFTLGNIAEKEGRLSDALHNYLLTVTVFYADRAITARAQDRADTLRKNGGLAVP